MTQFKVYASKDNEGQIVGATVVAYDSGDKVIEKITVLDEQEISSMNRLISELDAKHTSDVSRIDGEVTRIDGELDGKASTGHNHDSSYYSKAYIDDLESGLVSRIGDIVSFDTVVVDELPSTGVKGVFYFVPKDSLDDLNNIYEEFIWIDDTGAFEFVGSTEVTVDLSDYYTRGEVDALIVQSFVDNGGYSKSEVDGLLDGKANSGHDHDGRYYTESEVDAMLGGKASTSVASSISNGLMSSADKSKLDGISEGANRTVVDSSLSSSSVNPVQNKIVFQELGEKSDSSHTHDDRYYTETEIDSKLNGKSDSSHSHDDRYFTESEMNSKLSGKSDTGHTHNSLNPTPIPAGADLNNYKTGGLYNTNSWADAQTIKNMPAKHSFILEVQNTEGGLVKQIFHAIDIGEGRMFERVFHTQVWRWGDWIEYYNTGNTPTSSSDLATEFHTARVAQVGIISWWTRTINATQKDTWVTLYTLPFTNKAKTVYTGNLSNQTDKAIYFRVNANSNLLQYYASTTGEIPIQSGQLILFASTTLGGG